MEESQRLDEEINELEDNLKTMNVEPADPTTKEYYLKEQPMVRTGLCNMYLNKPKFT